ncbi:hypothetical protein D3C78_623310 [compost metagenome]
MPSPMEREKKANPMASSTPDMPSLLKSGIRKWRTPAMALGRVRPKATSSRIMMKRAGIIQRRVRSTPFCTPPCTNHQVRAANSRWVSTGQSGSPT